MFDHKKLSCHATDLQEVKAIPEVRVEAVDERVHAKRVHPVSECWRVKRAIEQ